MVCFCIKCIPCVGNKEFDFTMASFATVQEPVKSLLWVGCVVFASSLLPSSLSQLSVRNANLVRKRR
jgi:hypothetical protein